MLNRKSCLNKFSIIHPFSGISSYSWCYSPLQHHFPESTCPYFNNHHVVWFFSSCIASLFLYFAVHNHNNDICNWHLNVFPFSSLNIQGCEQRWFRTSGYDLCMGLEWTRKEKKQPAAMTYAWVWDDQRKRKSNQWLWLMHGFGMNEEREQTTSGSNLCMVLGWTRKKKKQPMAMTYAWAWDDRGKASSFHNKHNQEIIYISNNVCTRSIDGILM